MLRYFLICLFLLPFSLLAQEVKVVAPEEVGIDDYFQVRYIVENADADGIELPELHDFILLSGPNLSTSSSMMYSGGKMTQSKSTTYTYVIEPKAKGEFTLPAAQLKIDGKKVLAKKVRIKVTGERKQQNASSSRSNAQSVTSIKNITEKDLYVRPILSKTKVMEQEALILTYRVYWRMGVGLSNIYLQKAPDFQGFVTHEIPITTLNVSTETVGGELYKVADRLKYVLFPQQSGDLELAPLSLDCEVVESDPTMDAFDAFFNGRMRSRVIKCVAPKANIAVTSLPEPKPDDFIGVVGNLTMQGAWTTPTLVSGAPATYRLTVKGEGTLKLMLTPALTSNADMDVYDVSTTETLEITPSGHEGKVEYDYTIVPKSAGKFTLPALTGSFYNPSTQRYEQLKVVPNEVTVLPPVGGNADTRSDYQTDIHTIHEGTHEVVSADDYIEWGGVSDVLRYVIVLGCGIALYFGVSAYRKRDLTEQAQREAHRKALQQLKPAEALIATKENAKFYALVSDAIADFLMAKYQFQRSELSKQQIENRLKLKQVDAATIQRLLKVIDECEFAKFAPASDEGGLKNLLNEVKDIMRSL